MTAGVGQDGRPSLLWQDAVRVFNRADDMAALSRTLRPLTPGETAWRDLIMARAAGWADDLQRLEAPFADTEPPASVVVVYGNQGGNDAFVSGETVIAFDLQRLDSLYGAATKPENPDRLDRIFAHEYTHLMHKAWRREAGLELSSPLELALWACLTEGLGNYRSLSARWRDGDGRLTAHALAVLRNLEPIFVDRLAALAQATPDEAAELTRGLSMGPFEQKWGALPVALWLARETAQGEAVLADWVERGPWGVLELARKYLSPEMAGRLPSAPRTAHR